MSTNSAIKRRERQVKKYIFAIFEKTKEIDLMAIMSSHRVHSDYPYQKFKENK